MAKILFEKDGIQTYGRGAARIAELRRLGFKEVKAVEAPGESKPDLEAMGMKELRALAEAEGLEGYKALPKPDLLEALAAKLKGDE